MKQRLLVILYLFDCFVLSLITLGACKIGETISSVAFITEKDGRLVGKIMRPVIDTLFFFDTDHCYKAWKTFCRITGTLR